MHAILQWFDGPGGTRLGMALVHFLWEGALLGLGGAGLAVSMCRPTSQRRYAALLVVLAVMAAAPIVTFFRLPTPAEVSLRTGAGDVAIVTSNARAAVASPLSDASTPRLQSGSISGSPYDGKVTTDVDLETSLALRAATAWRWIAARLSWFVAAWLSGVCLFTIRLAVGLRGASRIRRVGIAPVPEACRESCAELSKRLRLNRLVGVYESALVQVPVVVGYLQPVLLLPASVLAGLPEAELRAILAHELAHIRRHDYLIIVLQSVVETLLFYHPAVWLVSRAIRQEREQCCDDLAADVCGNRAVVAKALVRLAEIRALPAGVAMAATSGRLAQRVRRLISSPRSTRESTVWRSAAGPLLACLTVSLVVTGLFVCSGGFVARTASAQDSKPEANHARGSIGATPTEKSSKDRPGDPMSRLPYLSRLFRVAVSSDSSDDGERADSNGRSNAAQTDSRQYGVEALETPINLEYQDSPLDKVLKDIRNKTNLSIMVDESALKRLDLSSDRRITVKLSDLPAKDALRQILQAADPRLVYEIKPDCLFITAPENKANTGPHESTGEGGNSDRLNQQLRRLEQQNEETRRALVKLEEQLKAEQNKPQTGPTYIKRATEKDVRLARLYQLQEREKSEAEKLAGTWKVVTVEADGNEHPVSHAQSWEFQGHEVAVGTADDNGQREHNSFMYFVNPLKSPQEMTIYGKNMLIQAIYRLDDDTLTICYFGRSEVDRPTSFTPTKDNDLPLVVTTLHRADRTHKQSY